MRARCVRCALSTRSINTPTDKRPLDQSTRERARVRARSRTRRVCPRQRDLVYIGIFIAVYHFCSAVPPFYTLPHGLFKVSRRRARACACAMLRAMLANRLLRALHRPCCQTAYVYTRVYVHVRVHIASFTSTRSSARIIHTHTHVSTAILRHSANQWRNCKPVHPRGPPVVHIRRVDFQSLFSSHLRFSLFFHSIAFHRFTGCPRLYA